MKPTAFVASSSESREIADTLQEILAPQGIEVTVWDQDLLPPSSSILDGLVRSIDQFDFGIFIFAPVDTALIRGETLRSVRDNVLFEMGLFVGRLGKERTFIVGPRDTKDMRLATDLLGVVAITYDLNRDDRNTVAALAPAANRVARTIKKIGVRPDRSLRGAVTGADLAAAGSRIRELTPAEKIIIDAPIGRSSFVVINDDICEAATDIIVSSDDNHFTARGGVSKAILQRLGPEVRRQLDHFGSKHFRQGHLAVTAGGTWDCRAVFHAAVIDLDENRYPTVECIRLLMRRILACAVAMGARTIAVPVLGGGYATKHLTPAQTVRAIASEVVAFLSAQDPSHDGLTRVAFYVFKREDIDGLPEELAREGHGQVRPT